MGRGKNLIRLVIMVNFFDFGFTPSGENRQTLVRRMKRLTEDARSSGGRADRKLIGTRTGPAERARAIRSQMQQGYRPRYASERGNKFIDSGQDAGYGAHRAFAGPRTERFDLLGYQTMAAQDAARATRPVGQTSLNALTLINSGDARVGRRNRGIEGVTFGEGGLQGRSTQAMLALPGPSLPGFTSVAGTRALGYAPQIAPPAVMQLPYRGFDPNHPLDLT